MGELLAFSLQNVLLLTECAASQTRYSENILVGVARQDESTIVRGCHPPVLPADEITESHSFVADASRLCVLDRACRPRVRSEE